MKRSAHRRHRGRAVALVSVALLLALPTSASAVPAVDEYTFDPPDAGGKKQNVEAAPAPRRGALDPAVARALANAPDGEALAAIATSSELGAPDDAGHQGTHADGLGTRADGLGDAGSADPGVLTAAADAVRDPASLAVIAALLGVGAVLFFTRRRSGES